MVANTSPTYGITVTSFILYNECVSIIMEVMRSTITMSPGGKARLSVWNWLLYYTTRILVLHTMEVQPCNNEHSVESDQVVRAKHSQTWRWTTTKLPGLWQWLDVVNNLRTPRKCLFPRESYQPRCWILRRIPSRNDSNFYHKMLSNILWPFLWSNSYGEGYELLTKYSWLLTSAVQMCTYQQVHQSFVWS